MGRRHKVLVLHIGRAGVERIIIRGNQIDGLELARRLQLWIEAIDGAAHCVSSDDDADRWVEEESERFARDH